jgi:predicted anti-sigma-YlaC factor YlaD
MWSLLKKNRNECSRVRESLENDANMAAPALQEHLQACSDCQAAVDELLMSRELLRALPPQAAAPEPWFAPRVMAAIAARETELRRSLETWSTVPRLAARLVWISTLALLLAGTWLYKAPRATAVRSTGDSASESLFDSPPAPAAGEDVLVSRAGPEQ